MSIFIVYTLEVQLHHYIVSKGYSLDNADHARIHKGKVLQSSTLQDLPPSFHAPASSIALRDCTIPLLK
jgi:hypothetical protein